MRLAWIALVGLGFACQSKKPGDIAAGNNDAIPVAITCKPGTNCPATLCGNGTCNAGESCSVCPQDCTDANNQPCRRVGVIYSVWHQPTAYAAALAAQQNITLLSLEDVLRSRQEVLNGNTKGFSFADIYNNSTVAQAAGNYYYQYRPQDGYYCIYHHREPDDLNYQPQTDGSAPYDCPNYASVLQKHAEMLVAAGIDFVVVDMSHAAEYSATWDIAQQRPFEVLVQQWANLRANGMTTPDIAAWQALPDAADGNLTMAALALNVYNDTAYGNIMMRDAGTNKRVWFYPSQNSVDANTVGNIESNGGRDDIITVPMWVNQQADGAWSSFALCHTPVFLDDTPCAQIPTFNSKIGSQVAVSPSAQISFASLPFQATGVYAGMTLRKQFVQALSQKPDYLLLSFWNEQIAEAFTPEDGPSLGLENDATAGASAFVGLYGVEFSHDIEPSQEYGTLLYDIVSSCLILYRGGVTACTDANVLCCAGGAFSDTYTYYNGAQGEFGLYANNPNSSLVLLNLCLSAPSDYFLSSDATCEGQQISQTLGYIGTAKGGETLRALRRCFSQTRATNTALAARVLRVWTKNLFSAMCAD